MKYLKTKHERNSAKITTLLVLIVVLLCFVVGQDYKELPEEYGVALDFGNAAHAGGKASPIQSNVPQEAESKETPEEEVVDEEIIKEEVIEEEVIKETKEEEKLVEEKLEEERLEQEALEKEKIEEEKAAEEAIAAEKLLAQQEEEALRIKTEQEAAEAKKIQETKEAKEKLENQANAAKEAKEKADKAAAVKKAADAKAKADIEAKAAEAKTKAAAAKKAAADKAAKAKAIADGKAAAEAKAAADAKAKSDANAAAAKVKTEGNGQGSGGDNFSLNEIAPIYPGCSGGDNNAKNKCMREKIQQFIAENYNTEVASDLSGIQKIRIFLNIDTAGNFVGINAKASDPKLEVEAKRVGNLLPKVKPAMQQGKPVKTRFQLAINIELK